MAVSGGVACKPDGDGGEWVLYRHHDDTAQLMHRRAPGEPAVTRTSRIRMDQMLRYLVREGIGRAGWSPV